MMIQLNGRYIDTDSISVISGVYLRSESSSAKSYAFWILLKGRDKEIVFSWDMKTYDAETPESLRQKVDAIRHRLARKISTEVENLDATIDLRKKDINNQPLKKPAQKKSAR